MSTDLCGVRVIAIDPEQRRIRLRVFVVYYETQGPRRSHERTWSSGAPERAR